MTYVSEVTTDAPTLWLRYENSAALGTNSGSAAYTEAHAGVSAVAQTGPLGSGAVSFGTATGTYQTMTPSVSEPMYQTNASWTVEAWVKRSAVTALQDIINRNVGTNNPTYIFINNSTATSPSTANAITVQRNNGSTNDYVYGTIPILADGKYHHIVITHDTTVGTGGTTTIYVDGVAGGSKANGSFTNTAASNTNPYYIGANGMTTSNAGNGLAMDEVAVYNKSLSATRVAAHYNAVANPSTPVTATPPIIDFGASALTMVAPVVSIVVPDVTNVVPVMTASMAIPAPVAIGGYSATVAVPAINAGSINAPSGVTASGSYNYNVTKDGGNQSGSYNYTNAVEYAGTSNQAWFGTAPFSAPSGMNAVSATFNFYVAVSGASGLLAYGTAVRSWAEGDNVSPYGNLDNTGAFGKITPKAGWNSIDVTAQVKSWMAGTTANNGIVFYHSINDTVSGAYALSSHRSANVPYIAVQYAPIVSATNSVPPITLGADLVAPSVTTVFQTPDASNAVAPFTGSLATVDPTSSANSNAVNAAPVMAVSLDFLGGKTYNPDFVAAVGVFSANMTAPNAKQFIEYNVLVQAPCTYLGNLENEIATVNLTTNRLSAVVGAMNLTNLKTIRPIVNGVDGGDRYLSMLPSTLDADDIWYKLNEVDGATRAVDSETGLSTDGTPVTVWQQSGYLFGSPTVCTDGPQLRNGLHFDGVDDYLVVGPYNATSDAASPSDITSGMAMTIEFSIRTTQQNGVVFTGGGSSHSNTFYGDELQIVNGELVLVSARYGVSVRVRQKIADGQWHHVVIAFPSIDPFGTPKNMGLTIPDSEHGPANYVAIDGKPVLVRTGGSFLSTVQDNSQWIPWTFMARGNPTYALQASTMGANQPIGAGTGTGFLAGDLRDLVVRLNTYIGRDEMTNLYYAWSDSMLVEPGPMEVTLSSVSPFRAKGNTKKMLAIYGLPWGYDSQGTMPLYTYASTLSGMVIANLGNSEHVPNGSTFGAHSPVFKQVETFTVGDYLVYPVDITGGGMNGGLSGDGNISTEVTSVAGVLNRDSTFMREYLDGRGYGGFVDDTTGLPRFINLQTDLVDMTDFDLITAVNYPWETPLQGHITGETKYPANSELCQKSMGLTNEEWTEARNALRDSILEAAYDGANLWIGEYHMAQHLGFIGRYDTHDYGQVDGKRNVHARDLDVAHGSTTAGGYLGSTGEYDPQPQMLYNRRVTALLPGLTDLPTTELGDHISAWSYDRWKADGDFTAADLVRRPNGLQIGDLCALSDRQFYGFLGVGATIDIPFVQNGTNYGWFNSSVNALTGGGLDGNNFYRTKIISARPDEVVGTPVSREMAGYYGTGGVWVDNPYKDNVLTVAAEVGTVVRGRAIAGRAFIELMDVAISPTFVMESQPLPADQQKTPGVILRWSPSTWFSTWEFDTRRDRQVMATLTKSTLTAIGGGFGVINSSINYMSYTDTPVIYHRRETMHSRGLNWLSQTRTLGSGDVAVYQTAFTLTLTEPSATVTQTSNPTVQVSAMRLDMEVRQPRNYLSGDVEVRTLPAEMFLDMKGRGAVVSASAMTLDLSAVGAVARADTEIITVFLDSDSETITLFLKEDN